MKCMNCGKMLDHVDHDCKWCTFCGTGFEAKVIDNVDKNEKHG